jgi:hemerythrin
MPNFAWNENLSVNVKEFDEHHKKLIDLINQLHDAMGQGKGQMELYSIFDKLIAYTRMHFASEERLMAKLGYPALAAHHALHEALTQKVVDYQAEFKKGQLGVSLKVSVFLKDWLTSHIMKEDKQYSSFFKSKAIE